MFALSFHSQPITNFTLQIRYLKLLQLWFLNVFVNKIVTISIIIVFTSITGSKHDQLSYKIELQKLLCYPLLD